MNYAEEPWIKVYTRSTVAWMRLPIAARGLALELARHADDDGMIQLGEGDAVENLAFLLRCSRADIECGLNALCAAKRIRFVMEAVLLLGHADRQKRPEPIPGVERTRTWRERKARDAAVTAVTTVTSPVTVTTDRSDQIDQKEREIEAPLAPVIPIVKRGQRLPETWKASPKLDEWCRTKGTTAQAHSEHFICYWQAASGRSATKQNWDRAFQVWVLSDLKRQPGRPSWQRDQPKTLDERRADLSPDAAKWFRDQELNRNKPTPEEIERAKSRARGTT